ncbi:MAG: SDR family oxidoreductase [Anaerolineales bacterium]|jgi:NAD(P)-dependent dehydrogenase (short-subunit alcohol dehydrogenase family)
MGDKKVVIITGTAGGIGAACMRTFSKHDYSVVGLDIQPEGRSVAEDIKKTGGEALFLRCDVAKENQVVSCVTQVGKKYGHVDVLVNNAGIVLVKPFDQISWEEFRHTTDVNLGGHFLLCKYVLPFMKKQKSGVIVNMGSVSGHVGQTDHVMYGATKGAIIAMTRALAWELAPYNIRVNSISPGSVDTPMLRGDIDLESRRTGIPFEQVKKEREGEQAMRRWAEPSEIAEPIYFLASEGASFVTGADWLVDCGWVAR